MSSGRGFMSLNGGGSRHGDAVIVETVLVRSVDGDGSAMTGTGLVSQTPFAFRK